MKKKSNTAVPDFSRKRPGTAKTGDPSAQPDAGSQRSHTPDPRQPQKAPTKAKNGGRRGT